MNIQLPIIIHEKGDITVFSSKRVAEEYIEPYDINVLDAYDGEGYRLKLVSNVQNKKILGFQTTIERVDIQTMDNEVAGTQELREILITYLLNIQKVKRKPFLQENWNLYSTSKLIKIVSEIAMVK